MVHRDLRIDLNFKWCTHKLIQCSTWLLSFLPAAAGLHLAIFSRWTFCGVFLQEKFQSSVNEFQQTCLKKSGVSMKLQSSHNEFQGPVQWSHRSQIIQSSHKEFEGPVQWSHRSQKIAPSNLPAAGILGPDLVIQLSLAERQVALPHDQGRPATPREDERRHRLHGVTDGYHSKFCIICSMSNFILTHNTS